MQPNTRFQEIIRAYNYDAIRSYIEANKGLLTSEELKFIHSEDNQMVFEIIAICNYVPTLEVLKLFKRNEVTVELLTRLVSHGMPINALLINHLISNDLIEQFRYLLDTRPQVFSGMYKVILKCAFNYGVLDIIELVFDYVERNILTLPEGTNIRTECYQFNQPLIEKSHLHVLEFLLRKYFDGRVSGTDYFTVQELELAISHCNLDIFSLVYENTDFHTEDMKSLIYDFLDEASRYGKTEIYVYLFNKLESLTQPEEFNEKELNDKIGELIRIQRTKIAKFLIEKFINRLNKFPNVSMSSALVTNDIEFINYLILNNPNITYAIEHIIIRWIENNKIIFTFNDIIYQKIIKNHLLDQRTYPYIYSSVFNQIAEVNLSIKELNKIMCKDECSLVKEILSSIGTLWDYHYNEVMNILNDINEEEQQ